MSRAVGSGRAHQDQGLWLLMGRKVLVKSAIRSGSWQDLGSRRAWGRLKASLSPEIPAPLWEWAGGEGILAAEFVWSAQSHLLPPGKPQLLPPLQGSGFTFGFSTPMPLFCWTKRPERSLDKLLCSWIDSAGETRVEKEENS